MKEKKLLLAARKAKKKQKAKFYMFWISLSCSGRKWNFIFFKTREFWWNDNKNKYKPNSFYIKTSALRKPIKANNKHRSLQICKTKYARVSKSHAHPLYAYEFQIKFIIKGIYLFYWTLEIFRDTIWEVVKQTRFHIALRLHWKSFFIAYLFMYVDQSL